MSELNQEQVMIKEFKLRRSTLSRIDLKAKEGIHPLFKDETLIVEIVIMLDCLFKEQPIPNPKSLEIEIKLILIHNSSNKRENVDLIALKSILIRLFRPSSLEAKLVQTTISLSWLMRTSSKCKRDLTPKASKKRDSHHHPK